MTPEFSRPVPLDRIGLKDKTFTLEADDRERQALAGRLGILAVKSMTAAVSLRLIQGGKRVLLQGHVRAELVQVCVVSLEPTDTLVDEDFSLTYAVENQRGAAEVVVELDAEDPPEPIENGLIDIGEAAAEHLALAMDPFPRAPGADFEAPSPEEAPTGPAKANPFEVLAEHRKKM